MNDLESMLLDDWWTGPRNIVKKRKVEDNGGGENLNERNLLIWNNQLIVRKISDYLSSLDRYALATAIKPVVFDEKIIQDTILPPTVSRTIQSFPEHMGRVARIIAQGLRVNVNLHKVVMKNGLALAMNSLHNNRYEDHQCQYSWTFRSCYSDSFRNIWVHREINNSKIAESFPRVWKDIVLRNFSCREYTCPQHTHFINGRGYEIIWSTIDMHGLSDIEMMRRCDFPGVLVAAHNYNKVFFLLVHAGTFFDESNDHIYGFMIRCLKTYPCLPRPVFGTTQLEYTWLITILNKLQHNGLCYTKLQKKLRVERAAVKLTNESRENLFRRFGTCCRRHYAQLEQGTSHNTLITIYEKRARERMYQIKLCKLSRMQRIHHELSRSEQLDENSRFHTKIRSVNKLLYNGKITHAVQLGSPQQFLVCDHSSVCTCIKQNKFKQRYLRVPITYTRYDVFAELFRHPKSRENAHL
jgi:hypothetical protein